MWTRAELKERGRKVFITCNYRLNIYVEDVATGATAPEGETTLSSAPTS